MADYTLKLDENKSKGESVRVHCAECARQTKYLVLQSADQTGSEIVDQDHGSSVDWADHYQIVQCQGCETISFRHLHWFSEHQDFDWDGTTERLYPQRSNNTLTTRDFHNVPAALRRIYRETIDAFNYDALTLCAGGLRALVEGICAEQGVADGPVEITRPDGTTETKRKDNLQGKISGLHDRGILTKQNSDVLHEHRYLDNEALHELQQPPPTKLTLAIEIIEHTLEGLYEIPRKADELRHSKSKRTGGGKPAT